jgi:hypothetical protein
VFELFGGVFGFIGSAAFRVIFDRVFAYVDKRQDHKYELERMERQTEIDLKLADVRAKYAAQEADVRLRALQAQYAGAADLASIEAKIEGLRDATSSTGIHWVDAVVKMVRPSITAWIWILFGLACIRNGMQFGAEERELLGMITGFWFAERWMTKRATGQA